MLQLTHSYIYFREMLTIPEITKEILSRDNVNLEALRQRTLNLRAYARKIQKEVQKKSFKEVRIGTIVMALSRMEKTLEEVPGLAPSIKIEGLNIKSDLIVINYEKTADVLNILSSLSIERRDKDFFVISESLAEIAIIASIGNMEIIKSKISQRPKSEFKDAIAVTLRFNEDYVKVPNVLYGFVSSLAIKRVNLFEIVSTLTEVSFIINKDDMNATVDVFRGFL